MAKTPKKPVTSPKAAKPTAAKRAAGVKKPSVDTVEFLRDVSISGVNTGVAGWALNTADAVLRLLRHESTVALSPEQMANMLKTADGRKIDVGIITNDVIFLLGLGLVELSPADRTCYRATQKGK